MYEIGSEFFYDNFLQNCKQAFPEWLRFGNDQVLTFSGRTAIEVALCDALRHKEIRKALLPSYCCDSMIEPFRRLCIKVEFYNVYMQEGELRIDLNSNFLRNMDVVFFCNYFGYQTFYPEEQFRVFRENGGVVLEDITHSLFQVQPFHSESDYYVASIRKWGPVLSGGLACKKDGMFNKMEYSMPSKNFQEDKMRAMMLKAAYLRTGNDAEKGEYLKLFGQSNKEFVNNYSGKAIDNISATLLNQWDWNQIRSVRQQNSKFLHMELKKVRGIKTLFELREGDCPLFVPVVCENGRDKLRERLIKERIYCPVHWPKSAEGCHSNLYDMELSLICDQRYSEVDMQRICEVLNNELK